MTVALRNPATPEQYAGAPVLEFPTGLVGFPTARCFALVPWDDGETPFFWLRSLDVPGLEFLVVPPRVFFPDYVPEIDDRSAELIGMVNPDDALVLVIVTVGDSPEEATANLLGPVVINAPARTAIQVVLAPDDHPIRQPLVAGAAAPAG